jgi:hypothetical protein
VGFTANSLLGREDEWNGIDDKAKISHIASDAKVTRESLPTFCSFNGKSNMKQK